MLTKAVERSGVTPRSNLEREARPPEDVDPSVVDADWVLNDSVAVVRRFDTQNTKPRAS